MRVLVTGAAGFIGSHTCERLVGAGHQVCGVDDLSTGRRENLSSLAAHPGFRLEVLDIVDPALRLLVAEERPDVVVHLAAQMDVRKSVADPLADARTNVLGTVNLLSAATSSGTGRVVFASSGGTVYGEPATVPVTEEAPLQPLSPYGAAKVAGEAYVSALCRLYGLAYCILALGNVYGPRQDPHGEAGVVSMFAGALVSGAPTWIYGDGSAVRDYVYVSDVVDAIERAVAGAADGTRLNVGTGRGTSVRELHTLVAGALGAPDRPGYRVARTGELQRIILDVGAAERVMGWRPRTSLAEGLSRTVEWVRDPRRDRVPA